VSKLGEFYSILNYWGIELTGCGRGNSGDTMNSGDTILNYEGNELTGYGRGTTVKTWHDWHEWLLRGFRTM
jgi:hypothetical protein